MPHSDAHKRGYKERHNTSLGTTQTYAQNPYDFKKDLRSFWDWHMGSAEALADYIIVQAKQLR